MNKINNFNNLVYKRIQLYGIKEPNGYPFYYFDNGISIRDFITWILRKFVNIFKKGE